MVSSSSEEQVSWTVSDWPDGSPPVSLFTYFLAKELRSADASLSFRDLLRRVDEQVDAHVANSAVGSRTRTPSSWGPASTARCARS